MTIPFAFFTATSNILRRTGSLRFMIILVRPDALEIK